jgi:hypothetical protein
MTITAGRIIHRFMRSETVAGMLSRQRFDHANLACLRIWQIAGLAGKRTGGR